jgi:hypothetical protein
LSENDVGDLRKCARTALDCADVCGATARVLSRHTGYDANITKAVLHAALCACTACVDECQLHAERHEHCRLCAEACRTAALACQDLLNKINNAAHAVSPEKLI